jgi:periplasmic divalent cation tolerance protein
MSMSATLAAPAGPEVVLVLTTLPAERADAIIEAVLAERLVACVNVTAVRSTYRWQGAIERADELLAICKTTPAAAPALQRRLSELHPYEIPEVLVVPTSGGLPAYLAWVSAEVDP